MLSAGLCLPAVAQSGPGGGEELRSVDPFKCYARVPKGSSQFEPRTVLLRDQFGTTLSRVDDAVSFCTATVTDAEGDIDPTAHLTCYPIHDVQTTIANQNLVIRNQFGEQRLLTSEASSCAFQPGRMGRPRLTISTTSSATAPQPSRKRRSSRAG